MFSNRNCLRIGFMVMRNQYEISSGNIFRDFGFPQPEKEDAKSDLAILIRSAIKQQKLTQKKAAELMQIDQQKISKIMRGLVSEFTIKQLLKIRERLCVS